MKKRISLAMMLAGMIPVLLMMILGLFSVSYYADRRMLSGLERESAVIAASLRSDELSDIAESLTDRRIVLISREGEIIYDSESEADVRFAHDAMKALEKSGKSSLTSCDRRGFFADSDYYCVRVTGEGSVLCYSFRGSTFSSVIGGVASMILAAILMIGVVTYLSRLFADRLTSPVIELAAELEKVDSAPSDVVYPELRSILAKIAFQRAEITRQLARVNKEKNRLATIINNMDEGLIILGSDLRVIMLNESACRLMKPRYPRDKCPGLHISEVLANDEIVASIERAESLTFESDGRHLQVHVKDIDNSSEHIGRIGLVLDVTERTEIERIKQEFTANVTHELKTPLTSISGYAELIESGMAKDDDARLFAGRIRRESARLLTLISDIIKLSRLDTQEGVDDFEPVELREVCVECIDLLADSADRAGVVLSLGAEKAVVNGTRRQLTELVYNLIDNAIRYNRSPGRVEVDIAHLDGEIRLRVSDTGIGIASEHLQRVFERFYRVDKSRSKATGGTGLGLAIVKHIAERHSARLELSSEVGKGTVVSVWFMG